MNNNAFSYLNFIHFSQLNLWDVKRHLLNLDIYNNDNYVLLRDILTNYKVSLNKKDIKQREIHIISKINFSGQLYLRPLEDVDSFKSNLFEIPNESLIYSKINVRHGCTFYNNTGKTIAGTSEYPVFIINKNKVRGEYLQKVLRTSYIKRYLDTKTTGFSKTRVPVDEFLNIKIPLPSLEKQKEIVDRYNAKIKLAEEQEKEAQNLEQEIDNYFLEKLGIKQIQKNLECTKNKYLTFINFKNLKRWDALAQNFYIYDLLKTSQYKLCKLGDVYNFINRSWIKKDLSKNQDYRYVEIGSVDLIKGITETKKITINNAPSRATQIIKNGDLIIGTTRPYLKKFAIVDEKHDNCICSSGFQVIEPSKSYNLLFLKEFLSSDIGIEQLKNKMTGALYPAITFEELKNILIPLPSLEIQNEVIATITKTKLQIKKLKETSEQNRKLAQEEFEKELFE